MQIKKLKDCTGGGVIFYTERSIKDYLYNTVLNLQPDCIVNQAYDQYMKYSCSPQSFFSVERIAYWKG